MKTKMFLIAALLGATALTATAGARFRVSIGFPAPVAVATPVLYATPFEPAPVTVVQTVPPCPGEGYVWVAGYWSNLPTGRAWVPGAWHYRSTPVAYVNDRHDARNWHDGYHGNDRHDGYDRDNRHDRDGYRR